MGICLVKTPRTAEEDGKESISGQKAERVDSDLSFSLDRAKAQSSNVSITHARYHSASDGGRRLEEDYEVDSTRVLGEGVSGLVVVAVGKKDGRKYALKRISKLKAHKVLRQLTAEVEIYLSLDHPHIAALRDVYETDSDIALLTECCEGGELYSRLSSSGTYSESDAAEATHQMLLALGYLHARNVVHRDLKLENFLYESQKASSSLKLIDFGFAKVWDPSTLMMASCGSIAYVSPDVLTAKGYTSQCDLWSLGIIVFMLLSGYPPFHGSEKDMRSNILAAKVDWSHTKRWSKVSDDAIDFVRKLLVQDPEARMNVGQALAHRWIELRSSARPEPVLEKDLLRSLRQYADTSRMRRAVLQLLAQELEPEETKELRDLFLSMDKSGDGTISMLELKQAIRSSREPGSPSAQEAEGSMSPKTPAARLTRAKSEVIGGLFEVLDANGDEQVYYSDFLAATMDARKQFRKEAVLAAFHRLDFDSSGTITADDLRMAIGETFEGVNVELLVKEADAACRGELDFQDFLGMLEQTDASLSPQAKRRTGIEPSFYLQSSSVP